jgi:hypothetical protein
VLCLCHCQSHHTLLVHQLSSTWLCAELVIACLNVFVPDPDPWKKRGSMAFSLLNSLPTATHPRAAQLPAQPRRVLHSLQPRISLAVSQGKHHSTLQLAWQLC